VEKRALLQKIPDDAVIALRASVLLATTRVLPDADGVGFSRSISMQSLFPLISTVIAIGNPFF
jgi:hypothetical protein